MERVLDIFEGNFRLKNDKRHYSAVYSHCRQRDVSHSFRKTRNVLQEVLLSVLLLLSVCLSSFAAVEEKPGTYFIGHLVPDTDSIISAIVAAQFFGGIAARSGELNLETKFLLHRFHLETPTFIANFSGKSVFLVDFNQTTQAPFSIHAEQISGIIDHHALQGTGFVFSKPISITIRPWGSTSTILATMFFAEKKEISPKLARAMIGAILSDTMNLQSPAATRTDYEMVQSLAPISGISFPEGTNALFKEMVEAKSNIDQLSAKEILGSDYKTYSMTGKKIGFCVAETLRPEVLLSRKQEILDEMNVMKKQDKLDYLFFNIVDSSKMHSKLFILSDQENDLAQKAFESKALTHVMEIDSLVSRKSQFIPKIQKVLESH